MCMINFLTKISNPKFKLNLFDKKNLNFLLTKKVYLIKR